MTTYRNKRTGELREDQPIHPYPARMGFDVVLFALTGDEWVPVTKAELKKAKNTLPAANLNSRERKP